VSSTLSGSERVGAGASAIQPSLRGEEGLADTSNKSPAPAPSRLFTGHEPDQPANKFHQGNGEDGKHYWLTPPELYDQLDDEHHFDFDPCPYPRPDGFDGLTCEWGESNYVNPPFGSIIHAGKKKGPTAWARKALEEAAKGKRVVLVYPIDKWILMLLAAGAQVSNLGDVRWLATEDGQPGNGTGRHIACFILRSEDPEMTHDREAMPDLRAAAAEWLIQRIEEQMAAVSESDRKIWVELANIQTFIDAYRDRFPRQELP
jgi:hypothetical protein